MKYIKLLIFGLVIQFSVQAQEVQRCVTTHYTDLLETKNPGFKQGMNDLFLAAQEYATTLKQKSNKSAADTIYRIPVVFHVVYKGAAQNVSTSLLQSQIDVLNEDYRRLNADTSNTRAIFKDRAADIGFEFFLATIDPDGNPTSGITRTPTTATFNFFNLDAMKSDASGGKDAWNTEEYLNIWVCDLGGLILGFAYPPAAAPNWPAGQLPSSPDLSGVVIHYEVIGRNNPLAVGQLAIADQGRTCVHEVGHFWGLRHIWGDSGDFFGNPDCDITQDDGFSDTPHMGNNSQATGCSFNKNTCTNGEFPDEPDMVENYMDYSTESCQNMFTQQQADLMRSMAVIGRPGLAKVIENDTLIFTTGTWIVLNGTDTLNLSAGNVVSIQNGDEVIFINENNGYAFSASTSGSLSSNSLVFVSEDGSFSMAEQTAISDLIAKNISLEPNPSKNFVRITHLKDLDISEVQILASNGQVLKNISLDHSDELVLDISDLANGLYWLSFKREAMHLSTKSMQVLR